MNINDLVRVELTERGRKTLAQYIIKSDDYISPNEWVGEWQMWRLMFVFGSHHCMGSDPLFEKNTITIVEVSP